MKGIIRFDEVTYWYPEKEEPAVEDLSMQVEEGDFVLLYGSSGSGKSTVCRMLNGLVPKYSGGRMKGTVIVDGLITKNNTITKLSSKIGLVFQDPESQFVMDSVENELSFGLENRNSPPAEVKRRVDYAVQKLGISHLLARKTGELSSGEKQKVILASIISMNPKVLVLDEPTSQLDPQARREFIKLVAKISREDNLTVMMVEHNVDEAIGFADYVYDLDKKRRMSSKEFQKEHIKKDPKPKRKRAKKGHPVVSVRNLSKYLSGRKIINDVNLDVYNGECLAIMGRNGAGKTTLVKHFNGLLSPDEGSVKVFGMDTTKTPVEELARYVSYLPQNPSDMLFCDTVWEEVEFTLRQMGLKADVGSMLQRFDLLNHKDDYPRDLSVGEKQRVALASILISNPRMVVLDEPTRGIDAKSREAMMEIVRSMTAEGRTVVLVTQDEKLAAALADRTMVVDEGRVQDD